MRINLTFKNVESDQVFRIVHEDERQVFMIQLEPVKDRVLPINISAQQFEENLVSGQFIPVSDPFFRFSLEPMNQKQRDKQEKDFKLIDELWKERKSDLLDPKKRNKVLIEQAGHLAIHPSTLRRKLSKYLRGGLSKRAMAPGFGRCGGKGKERKLSKKPGNSKAASLTTKQCEKLFETYYRKYYLKAKNKSLKEVHRRLIADKFGQNKAYSYEQAPSYQQFYRWAKKQDQEMALKKRKSERIYNLTQRPLTGSSLQRLEGPGDLFEVDATILDCYIVSHDEERVPIGRPVLYLIVDTYSKLITGLSLGLTGPSWMGMTGVLENMVEDKTAFCQRYGITIDEADWPVKGSIPQAILGDRGELISKNADSLVENFAIEIRNAPPYRADYKGTVEQKFDFFNHLVKTHLDGAVQKDFRQRGAPDYRTAAKLDLRQMTAVCIEIALCWNHHLMEDYPLNPDQIQAGVPAIPIELWNYGIDHYKSSLRSVDADTFKELILPHEVLTIRRDGIHLKGLVYVAADQQGRNFMNGHQGEKVKVFFDPTCLNSVTLYYNGKLFPLVLSGKSFTYQDMSVDEVDLYNENKRQNKQVNQEKATEVYARLYESLDSINRSAPLPKGRQNKTKLTKNIRENRKKEKLKETKDSQIIVEKTSTNAPVDYSDQIAQFIKKKKEER